MSSPRGENGQFLPRPWPLDKAGNPKREALAEKDPIAVAHRAEKPYSKEAKEERRKVSPEESGTRDPATGQLQGGIPGHQGSFGRIPTDLRTQLRDSAAERFKVLEEIADDLKASSRERKGAVELLLRYGLGPVTSHQVAVDGPLVGVINVLNQMPTESLKKLEAMNDKQLEQALGFMLGNGRQEAAESFKRKIEALVAAQQHEPPAERAMLPKPRPLDPKREVQPERDPEAVILTFYDGGLPKAKQEPPEAAEAVAETEPKKPASRSWPSPGHAVVSRESLRSHFL